MCPSLGEVKHTFVNLRQEPEADAGGALRRALSSPLITNDGDDAPEEAPADTAYIDETPLTDDEAWRAPKNDDRRGAVSSGRQES